MGAIHSLRVVRRIPVVVVKYNGVGSSKIDPKATSTCTEQEYENIGPAVRKVSTIGCER